MGWREAAQQQTRYRTDTVTWSYGEYDRNNVLISRDGELKLVVDGGAERTNGRFDYLCCFC